MENQEVNKENEEMWQRYEKGRTRGKIFGGLLVVVAGSLFLGKELGAEIPAWVLTWKTLLIAVGLLHAVKHGFTRMGWLIPVIVGAGFLLADLCPAIAIKPLLWPVLIILAGLFIMFKPRRDRHHYRHWERWQRRHGEYHTRFSCDREGESIHEDTIDSTSFMGGVKKIVLSKNFKGGEIVNVFGGAEINLSQADFEGSCTLELTNVFGGTKLIVPANWEISSDLTSVLGSIEDKRPIQPKTDQGKSKVLILKGTTFLGGIDIRSY